MNFDKAKWVGVDMGLNGAVAWLDKEGKLLGVIKMPVTTQGDVDFLTLAKFLNKFPKDVHVISEKLHSLFLAGKKQTFSFARQIALTECAILVNKLTWTEVNAKTWQASLWVGQKMLTKTVKLDKTTTKLKTDTKKISENTFIKLFPQHIKDKTIRLKSGRLHDGCVDSVLIGLYGKRANL